MNVLFITCWYPENANSLKGIFVKEHAKSISLSGNKIVVLFLNVSNSKKLYQKKEEVLFDENGIETHIISIRSKYWKVIYINPFLLFFFIKRYFTKKISPHFFPDIIHSNITNPTAILGYFLAKKLRKPHIISEHWSELDKYFKKNIFSFYARKAYSRAVAITAVSSFLKNMISKYVHNNNKIHVIPNVVDAQLFYYVPKTVSDKIIFSAIAVWEYPKLPELFIEALSEVQKKTDKPVELNIIGEGSFLKRFKEKKYNYKINYLGAVPHEKIPKLLHQSHFHLHASSVETFCLSVVEALFTGTPVIASNVGAIPGLVKNENLGVLCENNLQCWTEGIMKAINSRYNGEYISKEWKEELSSKNVGNKFNLLYTQVIQ